MCIYSASFFSKKLICRKKKFGCFIKILFCTPCFQVIFFATNQFACTSKVIFIFETNFHLSAVFITSVWKGFVYALWPQDFLVNCSTTELKLWWKARIVQEAQVLFGYIKVRKEGCKSANLDEMLLFQVTLMFPFHSKTITISNHRSLCNWENHKYHTFSIQKKAKQLTFPKYFFLFLVLLRTLSPM